MAKITNVTGLELKRDTSISPQKDYLEIEQGGTVVNLPGGGKLYLTDGILFRMLIEGGKPSLWYDNNGSKTMSDAINCNEDEFYAHNGELKEINNSNPLRVSFARLVSNKWNMTFVGGGDVRDGRKSTIITGLNSPNPIFLKIDREDDLKKGQFAFGKKF